MSVTDRKDLRHLGWGPGGGPSARPARLGTLGGMPAWCLPSGGPRDMGSRAFIGSHPKFHWFGFWVPGPEGTCRGHWADATDSAPVLIIG